VEASRIQAQAIIKVVAISLAVIAVAVLLTVIVLHVRTEIRWVFASLFGALALLPAVDRVESLRIRGRKVLGRPAGRHPRRAARNPHRRHDRGPDRRGVALAARDDAARYSWILGARRSARAGGGLTRRGLGRRRWCLFPESRPRAPAL
jgi:hypothetical protein